MALSRALKEHASMRKGVKIADPLCCDSPAAKSKPTKQHQDTKKQVGSSPNYVQYKPNTGKGKIKEII